MADTKDEVEDEGRSRTRTRTALTRSRTRAGPVRLSAFVFPPSAFVLRTALAMTRSGTESAPEGRARHFPAYHASESTTPFLNLSLRRRPPRCEGPPTAFLPPQAGPSTACGNLDHGSTDPSEAPTRMARPGCTGSGAVLPRAGPWRPRARPWWPGNGEVLTDRDGRYEGRSGRRRTKQKTKRRTKWRTKDEPRRPAPWRVLGRSGAPRGRAGSSFPLRPSHFASPFVLSLACDQLVVRPPSSKDFPPV